MKKIVTIVGARPQFIKVAPVSRKLRGEFQEILINTDQHYDYSMAGIFFEDLDLPTPNYNLGIGSSSHGKQTGEMIIKIEQILMNESPDAVLVYGDTNSTLAGALAASKLHIPVFHVEAGLRSYNKKMPEEINRVLTDHVSSLLFVPMESAANNLIREGINSNVFNVGDVMYDAFLFNVDIAMNRHSIRDFNVEEKEYYLATIHRAENTDSRERLEAVFRMISELRVPIIMPLHPRTEKKLKEYNLEHIINQPHLKIIPPVSYLEMILLEKCSQGIITDSGGIQKEAYFAGVPCYTLRNETEWIETVEIGANTLIDPINSSLTQVITENKEVNNSINLYGDGDASGKIVEVIKNFFSEA